MTPDPKATWVPVQRQDRQWYCELRGGPEADMCSVWHETREDALAHCARMAGGGAPNNPNAQMGDQLHPEHVHTVADMIVSTAEFAGLLPHAKGSPEHRALSVTLMKLDEARLWLAEYALLVGVDTETVGAEVSRG